jgi:acetylglutamate kinase
MQNRKLIVVKIGGSTLGEHDTTLEDIVQLQKNSAAVVVVHGGGKIITEWLAKLGAATQFVKGERVTDRAGLEVTNAVLSGVVNKELVASINCMGGRAVGLCGVDGSLLQGRIKSPELGYVGEIVEVDTSSVEGLLAYGFVPIISSISLNTFERPEGAPALLNVNADTAAGEIAAALKAAKLIFLTDIAGVCDKSGRVISSLNSREAEAVIASGVASGGMIPKIRAAIRALSRARETRIIDGRTPHALLRELESSQGGTTIIK